MKKSKFKRDFDYYIDEYMYNCRSRKLRPKTMSSYLDFNGISTHRFRKWYASEIYKANGYDIVLVQRLLQHSSAATTQRYIGIEPQRIEQAIEGHSLLI